MLKPNHFKLMLILAASALVLASCASVEKSGGVAPPAASFPNYKTAAISADFDPVKIAALEARMQKFVKDRETAGIATLLVKDGKIISHTQAGIRNVAGFKPITDETIYRIYSMTKPITGVALMKLYEEGKFSLDDPVSKFIPEFETLKVVKSYDESGNVFLEALERQPTMRELMSHTAGFGYGLFGDDPSNKAFRDQKILRSKDLQSFIDATAKVPLMHQPGEKWIYSAAVDVQGAIVERLSGQRFGAYLKSEIFDPLAMDDTGFFVPDEDYDRLSQVFGYHPVSKEFGPAPYAQFPEFAYRKETVSMESGGGGLASTLDDYARFCQMLANGGVLDGARILKAETVESMRTNLLKDHQRLSLSGTLDSAASDTLGFGLGFGVVTNRVSDTPVPGEGIYFWGGAAGTWFWIDPENDLYFIGMIQRFSQNGPAVDFRGISRAMVYDALKK